IEFRVGSQESEVSLRVYTTRPDTIFGVDFMVIAPELEIVNEIKSANQSAAVDEYLAYVKSRSERERMAEKKISGVFTGAYALNPFNGREIPIWISEYVLAGYGTGAIMAVPCGDERDHKFAKHFNIPITNIIGSHYNGEEANPTKYAILENSDFINGMVMKDAIDVVINKIEEMEIGVRKVNYKMRDAAFSRQRYWGEPFPIVWKDGIAYPLDESELPLILPEVENYSPGPEGEGPLANIQDWVNQLESKNPPAGGRGALETNTMPGYAGSSWYFLRYMDPQNDKEFCSRKASDYWGQVDLYIGGTEHAVGHLLYSRMWTKVLFDLGLIGFDEPFKRLLNQGMIQGSSRYIIRAQLFIKRINNVELENFSTVLVSDDFYRNWNPEGELMTSLKERYFKNIIIPTDASLDTISFNKIPALVDIVDGFELDIDGFKQWKNEYRDVTFICNHSGKFITMGEVEKMSKSKYNTVNPDDLVMKYGADTFRMYEMFLGPVEMSKPWDTKGIEGVHRFLKKFWRLFFKETKTPPAEGLGEALIV
ncbi:MAG: leucine--tRNA ligase, partial [Bacteroidota bacterium]